LVLATLAQKLRINGAGSLSEAACRVGYQSASQFSWELFPRVGVAPKLSVQNRGSGRKLPVIPSEQQIFDLAGNGTSRTSAAPSADERLYGMND